MIYRKDEYKSLKSNIDILSARIKKMKDDTQDSKKGSDKKIAHVII